MKTLHLLLVSIVASLVTVFCFTFFSPEPAPRASAFNPTSAGTYVLQSGISASQSTVTLTSFQEPESEIPYTMSYLNTDIVYGTISPTSGNSEFVSFSGITQNGNGTATLTGVVRGLARTPGVTGCVASSTLANPYPGQTKFILSNPACFYKEFLALRTNATSSAVLTFGSTTPPRYDSVGAQASGTYNATTSEFASILYVNSISFSGAPNATESVKGISELATQAEMAASTNLGGTAASLVLQSQYATSSPGSAGFWSVVTNSAAKIAQVFLDLTQSFTFSGGLTSSATTTIAASNASTTALVLNGLPYEISTTRGASSTVLAENGYGHLSWFRPEFSLIAATTTGGAIATTTLSGIPSAQDLMIVIDVLDTTSVHMQFNGDTSSIYDWGGLDFNGAAIGNQENTSAIRLVKGATTGARFSHINIRNITARTKMVSGQTVSDNAALNENWVNFGVWANTSAQISSISIGCFPATCPSGTVIRVYGSNQ